MAKLMRMREQLIKNNKDGSTGKRFSLWWNRIPNKQLDDEQSRSDESPTYHFCNVIDDTHQNVSHIIRGKKTSPNTPKQIQIVNALGYKGFEYIHLPLVPRRWWQDYQKGAATDLMSYREEGYLPMQSCNMLAKLGGQIQPKTSFQLKSLCALFEVQDIQRAGAVFDIEGWILVNQAHIAKLSSKVIMQAESFNKKNDFLLSDHHRII